MHGDFENNNIILKESDYLEYSEKFKLMETFVKSLFATNTILFVGFSADDPNVNQIYSWVNNILTKHKREAYLLQIDDIDRNYNLQKEYFNRKGIKIINYNEFSDNIEKFAQKNKNIIDEQIKQLQEKGQQLYKLLYFIKNSKGNLVDDYYNKLAPTKCLNFVLPNDLTNILGDNFWYCNNGILSSQNDLTFSNFLNTLKPNNNKKKEEIKSLLARLGVEQIIEYEWDKETRQEKDKIIIPPYKEPNYEILYLLNNFNYIEAKQLLGDIDNDDLLTNYIETNIKTVNVFEKVYILLKLKQYEKAYNLLKRISFEAKKRNLNLIFVISEFNRKTVGFKFYDKYAWNCSDEEKVQFANLQQELWAINIPKLVKRLLSPNEKHMMESKLNFEYIKKLDTKIFEKINEEKDIVPNFKALYYAFTANYIFIENYSEFKKLCNHSIKGTFQSIRRQLDGKHKYMIPEPEPIYFDALELILIITTIKPNDLIELVNNYKIKKISLKQPVKDITTVKDELLTAYKNLNNSIIELDLCADLREGYKYFDYLYNFFIIFSMIDLTKDDTSIIIEYYLNLLKKYDYFQYVHTRDEILRYLIEFIIKKYNDINTRNTLNEKILSELLLYILNKANEINDINKRDLITFSWITRNLSNIINDISSTFTGLPFSINDKCNSECLAHIFTFAYKFFNRAAQNKIKKIIINALNNNFNSELYHRACLENIIGPTVEFEENMVQVIEKKISAYNKLKIEKPKTRNGFTKNPIGLDEILDELSGVADLLNFGKIINSKLFAKYINHKDFKGNNYFEFTFDMQKYDYNKFDSKYLNYLTSEQLENLKIIINNDDSKKQIMKQKFINMISLNKDTDNRCRDKFLYLIFNEPLN